MFKLIKLKRRTQTKMEQDNLLGTPVMELPTMEFPNMTFPPISFDTDFDLGMSKESSQELIDSISG